LAALSVAQCANRDVDALRLLRWLARKLPNSDSFLMLGDGLFALGRLRAARAAWARAARLSTREGKPSIGRLAECRRERNAVVDDDPDGALGAIGRAREVARVDPQGAVDALLRARQRALRQQGYHDAAQLLRLSAWLLHRATDFRRARKLARMLVADAPTSANVALLAEIELSCGARPRARTLALSAKRMAKREGSLTHFRKAAEIAGLASTG
jgi:hypothetical protein